MFKHLAVAVVATVLAIGTSFANQTTAKVAIPVQKTTPTDGKQMFASYCAPCHGVDGRGHGPAAAALRAQPTDLTAMQSKNHGKFPDTHVVSVLRLGADVPAHESAEMPVWGPILGKLNRTNVQDKDLRISNLSRYLESIQSK